MVNYQFYGDSYIEGNNRIDGSLLYDNTLSKIYVGPYTGNKTRDGSIERPYQTISDALNIATDGSIIYLLPNPDMSNTYDINTNLSITKSITLTGSSGVIINVGNYEISIDAPNIIISDLIFTCNKNPFLNMITINQSNVSIHNNTFYGPSDYNPYTDGLITAIYIDPIAPISNILIQNNTFYRLTYPGLINNDVYGNISYNNTYYTTGWQINTSGTYNTGIMGNTGSFQNGLVISGNSWSVPKNKRGASLVDIAFNNNIDPTTYGGTGYISTQNSSANIYVYTTPLGPVYNINKNISYNNINDAITGADSGNTIFIYNTYTPGETVNLNKQLNLISDLPAVTVTQININSSNSNIVNITCSNLILQSGYVKLTATILTQVNGVAYGNSYTGTIYATDATKPYVQQYTNMTGGTYFATINDAVQFALSGNTIQIPSNTYAESINLNKSLTLSSISSTVTITQVTISANNSNINNITCSDLVLTSGYVNLASTILTKVNEVNYSNSYTGTIYATDATKPYVQQYTNMTGGAYFATINNAIIFALATNTIQVPSGTFTETLTINKALNIYGINKDMTGGILPLQSTQSKIIGGFILNTSDIEINGLEIVSNVSNSYPIIGNTTFNNNNNITIKSNWIHDIKSQQAIYRAVTSNYVNNWTINNNYMETFLSGTINTTMLYPNGINGLTITNNYIYHLTNGANRRGVNIDSCSNITFTGNMVDMNSTQYDDIYAVQVFYSNSVSDTGTMTFNNNILKGAYYGFVYTASSSFTTIFNNISISNNTFENMNWIGIYKDGGGSYNYNFIWKQATITGNTFKAMDYLAMSFGNPPDYGLSNAGTFNIGGNGAPLQNIRIYSNTYIDSSSIATNGYINLYSTGDANTPTYVYSMTPTTANNTNGIVIDSNLQYLQTATIAGLAYSPYTTIPNPIRIFTNTRTVNIYQPDSPIYLYLSEPNGFAQRTGISNMTIKDITSGNWYVLAGNNAMLINTAITASSSNDIINLSSGTFNQDINLSTNIVISKPLSIRGANYGTSAVNPVDGSRVIRPNPETIVTSSVSTTSTFYFDVRSSNVTIDGIQINLNGGRDAINTRTTNSTNLTISNLNYNNNYIVLTGNALTSGSNNAMLFGEDTSNINQDANAIVQNVNITGNYVDFSSMGGTKNIIRMTSMYRTLTTNYINFRSFVIDGNSFNTRNQAIATVYTFYNYYNSSITDIEITNNFFSGTNSATTLTGISIFYVRSSGSFINKINGNKFNNYSSGCNINFIDTNGEIRNNTFTNHVGTGSGISLPNGGIVSTTFTPIPTAVIPITGNVFSNDLLYRHMSAFSSNYNPTVMNTIFTATPANVFPGLVYVNQYTESPLPTEKSNNVFGAITSAITSTNTTTGDTLQLGAGTNIISYNENVNLTKSVILDGRDKMKTTINPTTGNGIQISSGSSAIKNLSITRTGNTDNGIIFPDTVSNITLNNVNISGFNYGIENQTTAVVSTINMDYVFCTGCNIGYRVASSGTVTGLTITNSKFNDNNLQGWFITATSGSTTNENNFNNINVSSTEFNNNKQKGLYIEKMSTAIFDGITVDGSGYDTNYNFNSGFELNLKYGTFSNITLQNSTITGCGATGTTQTNSLYSTALSIKARNDSPSYNTNPAVLSTVLIENNNIYGLTNAIGLGEPTKAQVGSLSAITINKNRLSAGDISDTNKKFVANNTSAAFSGYFPTAIWFGTTNTTEINNKLIQIPSYSYLPSSNLNDTPINYP